MPKIVKHATCTFILIFWNNLFEWNLISVANTIIETQDMKHYAREAKIVCIWEKELKLHANLNLVTKFN